MQGAYLTITIGIELFLLVGYFFYLLFRTNIELESRVSALSWLTGIISLITLGLIISVVLVASRMTNMDLVVASAILIVDVIGLYLIIDDIRRISRELALVEKTWLSIIPSHTVIFLEPWRKFSYGFFSIQDFYLVFGRPWNFNLKEFCDLFFYFIA